MSVPVRLALAGLLRAPGRTLVRLLVLAAATALLGSMILFIGNSLNTMTGGAVRSVPLDWQGPVGSYKADLQVAAGVARQPGVLQASPTATAPCWTPPTAVPPASRRPAQGQCSRCRRTTSRISRHSASCREGGARRRALGPADVIHAAGPDRRLRLPDRAPRCACPPFPGQRHRARDRPRHPLPAPESADWSGGGAAAGQHRRDDAGHVRHLLRARSCARSPRPASARAPFPAPRTASNGRCRRNSRRALSPAAPPTR